MENEKNPIQKNLEEKFKEFYPNENAPEGMKEEVFQTLETLNLIGDIADLFTAKLAQTEADFIDIVNKSTELNQEETED